MEESNVEKISANSYSRSERVTTNSIRRTASVVYRLIAARYRGASACSSDFHPVSGTATRSTPSAKLSARVRSATAEPHTTGHAIRGASSGGACRKDLATIFSNSEPADCKMRLLMLVNPLSSVVKILNSPPQGTQRPTEKSDSSISVNVHSAQAETRAAQTPAPHPAKAAAPQVAHPRPRSESPETSARESAPRQSNRSPSPAAKVAFSPAESPAASRGETRTSSDSDGLPGSPRNAAAYAHRMRACA